MKYKTENKIRRLTQKQENELFYVLNREKTKLEQIFSSMKLKDKKFSPAFNLAQAYYKDMNHFLDKKEYVKAFELQNYVWGILDCLAISKALQVPREIKGWFKADL
jgi:hypothetical protein